MQVCLKVQRESFPCAKCQLIQYCRWIRERPMPCKPIITTCESRYQMHISRFAWPVNQFHPLCVSDWRVVTDSSVGQLSVSLIIIYQLCGRVTAFARHNTDLSCPPHRCHRHLPPTPPQSSYLWGQRSRRSYLGVLLTTPPPPPPLFVLTGLQPQPLSCWV